MKYTAKQLKILLNADLDKPMDHCDIYSCYGISSDLPQCPLQGECGDINKHIAAAQNISEEELLGLLK